MSWHRRASGAGRLRPGRRCHRARGCRVRAPRSSWSRRSLLSMPRCSLTALCISAMTAPRLFAAPVPPRAAIRRPPGRSPSASMTRFAADCACSCETPAQRLAAFLGLNRQALGLRALPLLPTRGEAAGEVLSRQPQRLDVDALLTHHGDGVVDERVVGRVEEVIGQEAVDELLRHDHVRAQPPAPVAGSRSGRRLVAASSHSWTSSWSSPSMLLKSSQCRSMFSPTWETMMPSLSGCPGACCTLTRIARPTNWM